MRQGTMKFVFLVVLLAGNPALGGALTPQKASEKVGEKVTVEFQVKSAGSNSDGYGELYSEKDWTNRACFFLRFPKDMLAKLKTKKIPSLEYLLGDVVQATGTVQILDFGSKGKRPVIYVNDLALFKVLPSKADYTRTEAYKRTTANGFQVFINPNVQAHKRALAETKKELNRQLKNIARVLPKKKQKALAKVRIWLEWDSRAAKDGESLAAFHPSAGWLKQHGYNPDKAGDIEIANVRKFVVSSRTDQPWCVLHELAHAHHHLVLGEEHAGITAAYRQAMERKLYDSVIDIAGGKRRAYAATNAKEYYAELSEAFFGKNDFYPFTRAQLKKHDSVGFKLMQETWGVK